MDPAIYILLLVILILVYGVFQSIQETRSGPEDLKSRIATDQQNPDQQVLTLVTPYTQYPWYRSLFWDRYYDWYHTPYLYNFYDTYYHDYPRSGHLSEDYYRPYYHSYPYRYRNRYTKDIYKKHRYNTGMRRHVKPSNSPYSKSFRKDTTRGVGPRGNPGNPGVREWKKK